MPAARPRADAGADLLRPQDSADDLGKARSAGTESVLGPDAKSQVTVQYENGKPVGVRRSSSRTSIWSRT